MQLNIEKTKMTVYSLKKRKDTEECHLFEAELDASGKNCTPKPKSICRKMTTADSIANIFTCKDENSARLKCAEKGRTVCGICVSHLYADYS
jgi:hypothetical protein